MDNVAKSHKDARRRKTHPTSALSEVLARYAIFAGRTTAATEGTFTLQRWSCLAERGAMLNATDVDEIQIVKDYNENDRGAILNRCSTGLGTLLGQTRAADVHLRSC